MDCPNCKKTNDLTWKRYVMSPLGRHECEFCQAKFRFIIGIREVLMVTGSLLVFMGVPFVIAAELGAPLWLALMAAVPGFCVAILVDKYTSKWQRMELM